MLLPFFAAVGQGIDNRNNSNIGNRHSSNISNSSNISSSNHYDSDSKMSAHDYALHILDDDEVAGRSAWSLDLQIFLGEERGTQSFQGLEVWPVQYFPPGRGDIFPGI